MKAQGTVDVSVDTLEKVVMGLLDQSGSSLEERKLRTRHTLAQYEAQSRSDIEAFHIADSKECLRSPLQKHGTKRKKKMP